ncbi:MAG: hypothetical protein CMJ48_04690 [Planctomycetaceae bacterium]|nr:hypothetical protein [Planctomycetaceae bacterium]
MGISRIERVLVGYSPCYRCGTGVPQAAVGGFSGAEVFRIEAPAGAFALRAWPAGGMGVERIRGLHRLLAHVVAEGVTQVAAPVGASDGRTLIDVDGTLWQLEPWMPGVADYCDEPSEVRLREAMTVLARWHLAAARFEPSESEGRWFRTFEAERSPAVRERLTLLRQWRAKVPHLKDRLRVLPRDDFTDLADGLLAQFERLAGRITAELGTAAPMRYRLQPCLRDVWHDHLLFTGEQLTGLIDPAACRAENPAADLARLLGSLVQDDMQGWDVALAAYQTIRSLTIDELGLIAILDRSGVLLSGLTWLGRRCFDGQQLEGRVLERLQGFLARLQRM